MSTEDLYGCVVNVCYYNYTY